MKVIRFVDGAPRLIGFVPHDGHKTADVILNDVATVANVKGEGICFTACGDHSARCEWNRPIVTPQIV